MYTGDIDAILTLQASAYDDIVLERADAFLHKLAYAPRGCWVAEDRLGVCAYVFSHPGRWLNPPAIGAPLQATDDTDCWYLHDLVVAARARGQQLAQRLLAQVQCCARAAGCERVALTSLKHAVGYWQACGFTAIDAHPPLQTQLQEYGPGACYMAQAV